MSNLPALATPDHEALLRAVKLLERPSFAMKLADVVGQPVNRILKALPQFASRRLTAPLEAAIFECLEIAIQSLDDGPADAAAEPPSRWLPRIVTGLSGGVAGFFGAAALPIELPLTTTLMLRSIAEIARHAGEDLKSVETGMACLEVFALGDSRSVLRGDVGYYTTRALTAKLAAEVAALAVQQGVITAAAPAVRRMVAAIASRYGVAVSERAAAAAVPVIGALGGAAVNMLFMEHFQRIADAHFQIRRLERRYGDATIRAHYRSVATDGRRLIR